MKKIEYSIKTVSNCLIGNQTESFSIGGVDQATTMDENGNPMIHGSAIKGALRNMVREQDNQMKKTKELMKIILEDIKQKYDELEEHVKERDAIQKVIKKVEEICQLPVKAEYIFGIEGINNAPRLFFSDLRIMKESKNQDYFLIDTKNALEEKEGEILSRPRTYKVLKPGIKLKGYIVFQDFEQYSELLGDLFRELKEVLLLFNEGMYGLGNSKSRGYGRIEVLEKNIISK
ncbi:RAMP superfamily CRISPR-associated protein [Peptostreptococcus canis]|uniref:CRISPR-associated protein n=1 Tax=Peptostreptococcus canis TaxID=1159213 RepID=A0ABR6TLK8_9FIRM|nr:RAMP superfamily CRISPR-associated protein [Peptostreptococcus canis]MBC2576287.1 CRISPR-associated protein [Peptostreptococcus canis]MBP1998482.1 CRISPR-associated protein Csm3 [Peptostreptococcus canis]